MFTLFKICETECWHDFSWKQLLCTILKCKLYYFYVVAVFLAPLRWSVFLGHNGKWPYFLIFPSEFKMCNKMCLILLNKTIVTFSHNITQKCCPLLRVVLFSFRRWRAERRLWASMSIVTSVTVPTVKSQCRFLSHAWSSSVTKTVVQSSICASRRSTNFSVPMRRFPASMSSTAALSPCCATGWPSTWKSVLPATSVALSSGTAGLFQKLIWPSTKMFQKTLKLR